MTLPAIEHKTAADPRYSIIWLHGPSAIIRREPS
jgi:hypothetical protein